jgi:serine/threonine-protein kinase
MPPLVLRSGQKLGKYRIRRRLASGGMGQVFVAHDTVEGQDVALKLPLEGRPSLVDDLRREIRLVARLDHPNVLSIKNADVIDGHVVVAYALGEESLADRLRRRLSVRTALDYGAQLLGALAHAHEHHIVHCDVKPENIVLFADGTARLTDFGIAKVCLRTIEGSASGSLGYIAPEQALGRPTPRSDVFSAGLLIYRMITGELPQWPFEWPLPGHEKLKRCPPELIEVIRRSIEVDERKRYRDAGAMEAAFLRARSRTIRALNGTAGRTDRPHKTGSRNWRTLRVKQFKRAFKGALSLDRECAGCHEPVDERMHTCPWCSASPVQLLGETKYPAQCSRCERGIKLDWKYCPWCYGGKIGPLSTRTFTDRRYVARCHKCGDKRLMPFMRYCPSCNAKTKRRWRLGPGDQRCPGCDGSVAGGFWVSCAWCGTELPRD